MLEVDWMMARTFCSGDAAPRFDGCGDMHLGWFMNYSKIATLGIRFVALYYILYGALDCINTLNDMQSEPGFKPNTYLVLICYRLFIGLLLNRLSMPLGRLMARGLALDAPNDEGAK
jgi:hypothetical protein